MKGYGISFGAISVLNAIPCGIGSTIGIKLRTEAFYEESDHIEITLEDRPGMSDLLARTCVIRTLNELNIENRGYRLTVRSEIPPSVGLKSSSSVCNAIITAVLNAYSVVWEDIDIVRLGVECAKECNVTVTGAFDDACGCMFGGLVVTNNNENVIISKKSIPKYDVVICIPDQRITKDKVDVQRYRRFSDEFISLATKIDKDYLDVMTKNGRIVGSITGFDNISEEAITMGAAAAGVSGTGPATAILVEHGKGKEFAEKLECDTIVTETRSCISFSKGIVNGEVTVPPSKSLTHRAIFMATLSGKDCTIRNCLDSDDIDSTIKAVKAFGADVKKNNGTLSIRTDSLRPVSKRIDAGNSGTTMRFAMGVASLFDSEIVIDGDDSLRRRTMKGMIDALERCGVECSSENGRPPVKITGPIETNEITVDGSESSQFVSSLLMVSPLVSKPMKIIVEGEHISKPYIGMTISMMKKFGINVDETEDGFSVDRMYKGFDYTVPGDFSSAAYLLVAGGLAGQVTVKGLDINDYQGDRLILDILRKAGCTVTVNDTITCRNNGRPKAMDVDLSDTPDLFPIVAVLLSTADGTSRLYGAPHLRFKESDRISSTVKMLSSIGADVTETEDGCIINGVDALSGGAIEHCGDHRIMMAAVVASLISIKEITMDDDGCWKISYPKFVEDMRSLGVR